MEVRKIVALANAGFTAEQINSIAEAVGDTAEVPVQQEATAPVEVAATPEANQPLNGGESVLAAMGAIMGRLDRLTSAIHAGNIAATAQPPAETPESIIAGMLTNK